MKDANALLANKEGVNVDLGGSQVGPTGTSKRGLRGLLALAILLGTTLAGYALILTVLRSITIGA